MHSGKVPLPPWPYYGGQKARERNEANNPPAGLSWKNRHWWLAGWNDRDMELRACAA